MKIDPDIASDADFMRIYEVCDPFTMTSIERMYGLYRAVATSSIRTSLATLSSAASGWVAVRWSRDDARPDGRHLPRSASL